MSYISNNQRRYDVEGGAGGTTNVTIIPTPAVEGLLKTATAEKNTDFTIPAGANRVRIYHNDATGGEITVNGQALNYRDEALIYEAKEDTTTNPPTLDRVPALVVITNGKRVEYSVEYPSSSAVDPSTI